MTSKVYPRINLLKVLSYPFSVSPLFIIFFASIFISFSLLGPIAAVIVIFGLAMSSIWFTKYAFSILIHTAEGYAEVPEFGDSIIKPLDDFRPGKLLIVLFSHVMLLGSILSFDLILGYAYALVLLFFMPAIISVLGMENKLVQTFNVNELVRIIKCSGTSYWISFGFYCATTFLLMNVYESEVSLFFAVFITLYLILVSFHVIGLTLYTRRHEMGFATVHSPEQDADDFENGKLKLYQNIATNIYSRHRQPSTIHYLEEQLKEEPIDAYEWFYDEVMPWEIKPKFKRLFLQLYWRKLCEKGQFKKVHDSYIEHTEHDTDFSIEDSATRLWLLNAAIHVTDRDLIDNLSTALLQDTKDTDTHRQTVLVLLNYYIELQPDDTKAKTYLQLLDKHYPEMKDDKSIEAYRKVLTLTEGMPA